MSGVGTTRDRWGGGDRREDARGRGSFLVVLRAAALGALGALAACGPAGDEDAAPEDEGHLAAARAFYQEGSHDSALARFDLAVEGGTRPAEALNERGMTHAARGNLERAAADIDSALALRPDYVPALSNLAVVHLEQGRWDRALAELDSLAVLRPGDAKVFYDRAHAYRGMGRLERALEDLDRAIRLDSGLVEAYLTRGSLHARRDDLDRATADFETAVSLSGSEAARRNLGIARLEAEDYRAALEIFDELVSSRPLRARYHLYRGRAYRGLGREGEAEADFRRTLELTGNPGLREQAIRALREMEDGS